MDQQERRRKAIKMLREYKSNKAAIMTYNIDLQTLDALMINSNMAVTYDQPSGGQTNKVGSKVESEVIKIEQQRAWINGQIALLQNQVDKVDIALNNMEHPYKTLLRLKYIEGKRWSEVYRLLNYSEEYIRGKMHDMALNMVTGYLFPEVHLVGLFERGQ